MLLRDFECGPKLIAQTYDGAVVMASQHAGVQAKIREQYPNAIFVHCYVHRLNLVLAQSVSFIKEVKVFFVALSAFRTFFAVHKKD
jgi:small basic protein